MSSNHPLFPPAGNNNNNSNNNKKKRKSRTYLPLPVDDDTSGQKKRRNAPQRANTPMMAAPAQPAFGFGNPQLANPAIYGPHNPTPFTPMGSASLMPQYSPFQGQFQPQAQYLQQPPQHAPQLLPSAFQPISNMHPTSSLASPGFAAGQQTVKTVPILATGSRAHNRNIEFSDSTENLISTKTGGRRQQPGKPQAQAQAQVHPQGQPTLPCANCSREGHLVGDCVGPPNQVHGDLPACPICDSFAGRVKDNAGPSVHRFDDCHKVLAVLYRLRKEKYHRLDYKDLASLTNDELLMFFRALVVKRVRKVPIRTKLVCWIDTLREVARRFQNTEVIASLGNMRPWTKAYAIQQHKLGALQVKPWEFYDYEAGNTQSLPAGPVEQVETNWQDFVANGLPQFAAQIFVSSDRQQPTRTDTVPSGFGVPASRSYGNDMGQSWTPAVFSGSARQLGAAATEVSRGQRTLFSALSSSGPIQPPTLNAPLSSRRSPAQMDAGGNSASASLPSAPTSASDTSHVIEPNSEGVSNELVSPAPYTRGPITILKFGEFLNRGLTTAGPSSQASDAHSRLMKKGSGRPPQARPSQIPDT